MERPNRKDVKIFFDPISGMSERFVPHIDYVRMCDYANYLENKVAMIEDAKKEIKVNMSEATISGLMKSELNFRRNNGMRWSKLSLSEKLEILEHNKKLSCFEVDGERFAITAFVISKEDNDAIRFITDSMHVNNPSTFEDNGFFSNHEPSKTCRYKNYKMILQ